MSEINTDDLMHEQRSRGVALLTFNRPERLNAWSPALERAYGRALGQAAADPEVRAIVVTGAGRAFCAGADAAVLREYGQGNRPKANALPRPQTAFELAVPKPVIAAINGPAVGIGLVRALLCDIRFATEDSYVSTIYARRGLVAEHGTSWLLPALVGQSIAADLLLSARRVSAPEALAMGLINRVVTGPVVEAAVDYAADIAEQCAPEALAVIKRQLWDGRREALTAAYEDSERLSQLRYDSADFVEGVAAWREKRPPRFGPLSPVQAGAATSGGLAGSRTKN